MQKTQLPPLPRQLLATHPGLWPFSRPHQPQHVATGDGGFAGGLIRHLRSASLTGQPIFDHFHHHISPSSTITNYHQSLSTIASHGQQICTTLIMSHQQSLPYHPPLSTITAGKPLDAIGKPSLPTTVGQVDIMITHYYPCDHNQHQSP